MVQISSCKFCPGRVTICYNRRADGLSSTDADDLTTEQSQLTAVHTEGSSHLSRWEPSVIYSRLCSLLCDQTPDKSIVLGLPVFCEYVKRYLTTAIAAAAVIAKPHEYLTILLGDADRRCPGESSGKARGGCSSRALARGKCQLGRHAHAS